MIKCRIVLNDGSTKEARGRFTDEATFVRRLKEDGGLLTERGSITLFILREQIEQLVFFND